MVKKIINYMCIILINFFVFGMNLFLNKRYPEVIKKIMSLFESFFHSKEIAAIISMILFYAIPIFFLLKIYQITIGKRLNS